MSQGEQERRENHVKMVERKGKDNRDFDLGLESTLIDAVPILMSDGSFGGVMGEGTRWANEIERRG